MLYAGMKDEYGNIANILSDGSIDPRTERPLPRPEAERLTRLEYFLANRQGFYSPGSEKLLYYLARHIQEAEPRDPGNPRDMSSTAKIYLTKVFAGAMTFAFSKDSDVVRWDFLPRVMTTNPVIKTIMGEDMPTLIVRTENPATDEDNNVISNYHQRIDHILKNNLSN
jgi:hypothetical protein